MNLNSVSLERLLSLDFFQKYIADNLSREVSEAGGKVQSSLKSKMKPASKNYTRTGNVLNSFYNNSHKINVRVENGKISEISLFDKRLIIPKESSASYMFNHHMNWDRGIVWKGLNVPENVPIWLNDGFTVVGRNGSRHEWEGLNYIESALGTDDAIEYIQGILDKYMDKYMSAIKIKLEQTNII